MEQTLIFDGSEVSVYSYKGLSGPNLEAGPKFAIKELWNLRHYFSTLLSLLENQSVRLNKLLDF